MISKISTTLKTKEPIMVLTEASSDEKRTLTVRVPVVSRANTGQVDNLGAYLRFATALLNVKTENLRIVEDQRLGDSVLLPAKMNATMTGIIGAIKSPSGLFAGEIYKFDSGFKGNLVDILAAIRLLRTKSEVVRKRPQPTAPKAQKVHITSQAVLLEMFNEKAGLKDPALPQWSGLIIKSILSESTKMYFTGFPGVFFHSVKIHNETKSSDGVLNKLGYIPVVSSDQKLKEVILHDTNVKKINGKNIYEVLAIDGKEGRETDYREYRAAVALSLCKIDPTSDKPMKEQCSVTPTSVKNKNTLKYHKIQEGAVDALNLAYAIKVSLTEKKSKSTEEHYHNARNSLINNLNEAEFRDARGKKYPKYSDIPESIRGYLQKTYHRTVQAGDKSEKPRTIGVASPAEADPKRSSFEDPAIIQRGKKTGS
jgi:hypothetical protein